MKEFIEVSIELDEVKQLEENPKIVPVISIPTIMTNNLSHPVFKMDNDKDKWTNTKIGSAISLGFVMASIGLLTKDSAPSELVIFLVGIGSMVFSIGFLAMVAILFIKCTNRLYELNNDDGESLSSPIHQITTPNVVNENMITPTISPHAHSSLREKVGFSLKIDENSPRKSSPSNSPISTPGSESKNSTVLSVKYN